MLQVYEGYAAFTFSTLPGAFCSSRPASMSQLDLRMPRFRPVSWARFLPGLSMVP